LGRERENGFKFTTNTFWNSISEFCEYEEELTNESIKHIQLKNINICKTLISMMEK